MPVIAHSEAASNRSSVLAPRQADGVSSVLAGSGISVAIGRMALLMMAAVPAFFVGYVVPRRSLRRRRGPIMSRLQRLDGLTDPHGRRPDPHYLEVQGGTDAIPVVGFPIGEVILNGPSVQSPG
jgi:hypothetical protein